MWVDKKVKFFEFIDLKDLEILVELMREIFIIIFFLVKDLNCGIKEENFKNYEEK